MARVASLCDYGQWPKNQFHNIWNHSCGWVRCGLWLSPWHALVLWLLRGCCGVATVVVTVELEASVLEVEFVIGWVVTEVEFEVSEVEFVNVEFVCRRLTKEACECAETAPIGRAVATTSRSSERPFELIRVDFTSFSNPRGRI